MAECVNCAQTKRTMPVERGHSPSNAFAAH
jgi:hypothetical protein